VLASTCWACDRWPRCPSFSSAFLYACGQPPGPADWSSSVG
jgi:hypothetical protein